MPAWDQRFTEPGALSSTAPIDFPPSALRLPRTASGDDFDLLASRARCKNEPIGRGRGDARSPRTEHAQFANIAPRPLRRPPGEARNGTIGSPSRVRFRPPPPSTFRPQPCGFRVLPPVTTSTYSRPLLGANTTLDRDDPGCKGCRTGMSRPPPSRAGRHLRRWWSRRSPSFRPRRRSPNRSPRRRRRSPNRNRHSPRSRWLRARRRRGAPSCPRRSGGVPVAPASVTSRARRRARPGIEGRGMVGPRARRTCRTTTRSRKRRQQPLPSDAGPTRTLCSSSVDVDSSATSR